MKKIFTLIAFLILTAGFAWADDGKGLSLLNTGRDMYMKHCASCHHAERYGLKAPALIPETLRAYKSEELAKVIKDGLAASQMPSLKGVLTDGDIDKIISHITLPLNNVRWATGNG
ncbi:MAG: cytochrome c [Deltaproteobacteria bacterium]|nr:cytochrome c [Deltaproteobacteria bacterium]